MKDSDPTLKVEQFPLPGTELTDTIRILIVDDDPYDRSQIYNLCMNTDLNVHIVEAEGLLSFREALDSTRFDLVLIDYRLADGDGLEALEIVQKHHNNANAAAVMVAGEAHVDVAVTALKNGCVDYVYKDALQVATIRRAIVSAIHRAGMRQSLLTAEKQRNELLSVLRQIREASTTQMRPSLEVLRRKLSAIRLQLRRGSIPESEAHLADLESVWQRIAIFCDQLEASVQRHS